MSRYTCYYFSKLPSLAIKKDGGKELGRCYYQYDYTITSSTRLTAETINALFSAGLLGSGQSFGISSQCDGKEEPGFIEEVEGIMVNDYTGKHHPEIPPVLWNGAPAGTHKFHHYVYKTSTRCDSSD